MKKIKNFIKNFIVTLLFIISQINLTSEKKESLPFDKNGYTAMHNAILNNDILTIQVLAEAFPDEINRPSSFNKEKKQSFHDTPFHLAVYHKKWKALSILISLGANPNVHKASNKIPYNNTTSKKEQGFYRRAFEIAALSRKKQSKKANTSTGIQATCMQLNNETQTEKLLPPPYIAPPDYHSHESSYSELNPYANPYFPRNQKNNCFSNNPNCFKNVLESPEFLRTVEILERLVNK